jgi:hypothetical protein
VFPFQNNASFQSLRLDKPHNKFSTTRSRLPTSDAPLKRNLLTSAIKHHPRIWQSPLHVQAHRGNPLHLVFPGILFQETIHVHRVQSAGFGGNLKVQAFIIPKACDLWFGTAFHAVIPWPGAVY